MMMLNLGSARDALERKAGLEASRVCAP